jgi:uncharacterized protein YjbJ (UPF0337 family)
MSVFDTGKAASKSISEKAKSAVDDLTKNVASATEEAKGLLVDVQADAAENASKLKDDLQTKSDATGEKIHDAADSLSKQVGDKAEQVQSKLTAAVTTLKDKAEIVAKDIEGKLQEAKGSVTGDPIDKVSGEVKQATAALDSKIEDVKDNIKKSL